MRFRFAGHARFNKYRVRILVQGLGVCGVYISKDFAGMVFGLHVWYLGLSALLEKPLQSVQ